MARRKNSDKDEQLDFFDERELNSNREAIDDMSLAGKRKHHFFGKFLLLVIIGFIAYGCYYYFVQNTPKKTFTVTFDTLAKGVTEDDSPIEDISTNYKLKFNIKTENDDYRTLATIINKAAISGTIDVTNKYLQNNTILNYGSEEVFDLIAAGFLFSHRSLPPFLRVFLRHTRR